MESADEALKALMGRQFRAISLAGIDSAPATLLMTFGWADYPFIDAVHIRGEDDVTAYRSRSEDDGSSIFSTDNVVWTMAGGLVEVVGALLGLPAPGQPGAPQLLVPVSVSLWLPVASNAHHE